MRRKLFILLVAAAALAGSGTAAAQDRTGTFELSGFGGGYFGGTLYAGSNALFLNDVNISSAVTYGARLGYNLNRVVAIEFEWAQAKADITGPGGDVLFGQTVKLGTMTNNIYEGDVIVNLTRGRIVPYLMAGAGAMTFSASVPGESTGADTRFVATIGGGVKMWVTPKLAVRVDGRYRSAYISDSEGYYGGGCTHGCYYYWGSNWYGSGEVTGGLTYAFGK
ncbi:MAG TPA: outer membrane beta-barrel protein [Thermoanaerobaculia bacterium]|nr:outer membrane beta-barrel protein [Thermoanaerobaculia bacterium]HQR68699.1 outer membrane beta-barrel protein [Thermoanaerobaculia bacterium]